MQSDLIWRDDQLVAFELLFLLLTSEQIER